MEDELLSPSNPYPNFGGIFARVSIQLLCYYVLPVAKMSLEEKKKEEERVHIILMDLRVPIQVAAQCLDFIFLAYLLEKLSSKSKAFVHYTPLYFI